MKNYNRNVLSFISHSLKEKFISKYTKPLSFNIDSTEPIKSDSIFNSSNFKASGSWYWKGDIADIEENDVIKGNDFHIYLRTRYVGSVGKKIREDFHTMQSAINDDIIKFAQISKDSNKYIININNIIMKYADIFVMDNTTIRGNKQIKKNFIHFSSKDSNGIDYEGYLVFSNNAVDDSYKEYLFNLFDMDQQKS